MLVLPEVLLCGLAAVCVVERLCWEEWSSWTFYKKLVSPKCQLMTELQ